MDVTRLLLRPIKWIAGIFSCAYAFLAGSKWSIDRIVGWAGLSDDFKTILETAKTMLAAVPTWVLPSSLTALVIFGLAVIVEILITPRTARKRRIRAADRETLLLDLKQLSTTYQEEKDRQNPRSTGNVARIWNLHRKHADLFAHVADDERAFAVEFCIGILETEDDFTKAVEIVKERLKLPFKARLKADFRSGPITGSATLNVRKPPLHRKILYRVRGLLGFPPHSAQRAKEVVIMSFMKSRSFNSKELWKILCRASAHGLSKNFLVPLLVRRYS